MQEMPKPTPDHHRLARLAGHWQGQLIMPPSQWLPQGGVADAEIRARVAIADFHVITDYEQRMGGQVQFTGHGVYAWDGDANQVVLHWFDSVGTGREEFRGDWQGDRLALSSRTPMGIMRMTSDHGAPGRFTNRLELSEDDGRSWLVLYDGTYVRVD